MLETPGSSFHDDVLDVLEPSELSLVLFGSFALDGEETGRAGVATAGFSFSSLPSLPSFPSFPPWLPALARLDLDQSRHSCLYSATGSSLATAISVITSLTDAVISLRFLFRSMRSMAAMRRSEVMAAARRNTSITRLRLPVGAL